MMMNNFWLGAILGVISVPLLVFAIVFIAGGIMAVYQFVKMWGRKP